MVRGTVSVCVLTPDDECHGNSKLTYNLPPVCSILNPKTTWASGGREISFKGSNLEFVEKVKHVGPLEDIAPLNIAGAFSYSSPAVLDSALPRQVSVLLVVGNTTVTCRDQLTYQPDPQFISFTTTRTGNDMSVIIQKAVDSLELKESEIKVEAVQGENLYPCVIEKIESSNDITSVLCDIRSQPGISIDSLRITVGKVTSTLHKGRNWMNGIDLIRFIIFTSFAICVAVVMVGLNLHLKKMKMLRHQMQKLSEMTDCQNHNEGLVGMQTQV